MALLNCVKASGIRAFTELRQCVRSIAPLVGRKAVGPTCSTYRRLPLVQTPANPDAERDHQGQRPDPGARAADVPAAATRTSAPTTPRRDGAGLTQS
jgi:hypothetical protein